jgi:ArsR family transcriptional regulator
MDTTRSISARLFLPDTTETTSTRRSPAYECHTPAQTIPPDYPLSDEEIAVITKAIGHPMRVKILRLLAEHNTCITSDIVAEMPIAQSTVSEHLKILREAKLIQGEIEGPKISYCINRSVLAALERAISTL